MNYSIFSIATRSDSAIRTAAKVSKYALGFTAWAFMILVLGFINGCINSYELGKDLRAWWDATGCDWALAEIEPCVEAAKAVVAWFFGVERLWSCQNLHITLAANVAWWSDVVPAYKAAGVRFVGIVDNYLMGA